MKFLLLVLAFTAAPALAQEDDGSTIRIEKPSIQLNSDCERPEGLCIKPRAKKLLQTGGRRVQAAKDGTLMKFAKLAGVFMGTNDAAEFGAFKFRVVLDLR